MKNWAGNHAYRAETVHRPTSLSELQELILGARSLRALGSRHSFNDIADSSTIVDTTGLPEFLEVSSDRAAVTINGSMTYGRLCELLAPLGFALHNLASLPHIAVAGAIATGTHGSGDRNGNLATAVQALQIMGAEGEVGSLHRGDPDFNGSVVSLGALGVVTAITLAIEPAYMIEQRVYDGPTLAELASQFDSFFSAAYSVSAFTRWQDSAEQIWVKHRTAEPRSNAFDGLTEASSKRHPIVELSAEACTDQGGAAGLWADRLPHFKMDFTPSAGAEIQSEFFVDRTDAADAIGALSELGSELAEHLLISEIRTVAADQLWMSPHYQRDSVAFHFTWTPDQLGAERAARLVADALDHLAPRAHWGKIYYPARFDSTSFDRRDDFLALVDRFDPSHKFRNNWFDRHFDQH